MIMDNRIMGKLKGLKVIVENKKIFIGLCLVLVIYLGSLIYTRVSPYSPRKIGDVPVNMPSSPEYPLGTDPMGRDILTQLCYATVSSIQVGVAAAMMSFTISILLAILAGYYGGYVDSVISMVTEVFITPVSYTHLTLPTKRIV